MLAFVILAFLNIIDLVMTTWALSKGFREFNPFMIRVMNAIGVVPALILTKTIFLLGCFFLIPIYTWVIWILVVGYTALTVWNTKVLLRT